MPDRRNTVVMDRRASPRVVVDTGEVRERRRGGRPTRNDEPTKSYTVRLTEAERKRINQAARANRQKPSEFVRDAVVTAADDCLESIA